MQMLRTILVFKLHFSMRLYCNRHTDDVTVYCSVQAVMHPSLVHLLQYRCMEKCNLYICFAHQSPEL